MTADHTASAGEEGRHLAVRMRGIRKAFYGTLVLDDVDFDVAQGEVHALAGGNGAGKSTLMKILQGVYTKDAGSIAIDDREVDVRSIQDAKAHGIGMVFQEFSLVPSLTVAQNVFLGVEPVGRAGLVRDRHMRQAAAAVFEQMQVDINPSAVLGDLGTAYWQLTEIAKALAQDARVLIMDEPTASLAKHEADQLFELVGRLRDDGLSIIYISHRMDEVYRIADRITILRDGRRFLTEPLSEITPDRIVEGIVGRPVEGMAYSGSTSDEAAEVVLEVRDLTAEPRVRGISMEVRAGEIVGLAGLMGSGRTELARCLFGIDRPTSGEIRVHGKLLPFGSSAAAIAGGMALIPEDRRAQGLVLEHSVRDNLVLPLLSQISHGPLVSGKAGNAMAERLIETFRVKAPHPGRPVQLLSGGNQQKVVLAKWLGTEPDVLIMDEPTAGVDIGTKTEILTIIRELAQRGKAIVVISSEYSELLALSDRVLIMRSGRLVQEIARADLPDEEALQLAVQGVNV
jgi:ribose transport system ATP-binding protein